MGVDVTVIENGYVSHTMSVDLADLTGVMFGDNETYILVYTSGYEVQVDTLSGLEVMSALADYTNRLVGGGLGGYGAIDAS